MPPPKKPKTGPTRAELFLSREDLDTETTSLPSTPDSMSPAHSPAGATCTDDADSDTSAPSDCHSQHTATAQSTRLQTLTCTRPSSTTTSGWVEEHKDRVTRLHLIQSTVLDTVQQSSALPLKLCSQTSSECDQLTSTVLPPCERLHTTDNMLPSRVRDPTVQDGGEEEETVHSASSPLTPPVASSVSIGDHDDMRTGGLTSKSGSPLGSPQTQDRPHSTMDEYLQEHTSGLPDLHRTSKAAAGRRCQICDDGASGFHYGVWSCEGCKAFFKRSLQGTPPDYVCPAINNCTIDKQRRQSCKACRLRKCYAVGMFRNIRKEKSPRQPRPNTCTKRRSTEEFCEPSTTSPKIKREETGDHQPSACSQSYIGKLLEADLPQQVKHSDEGSTAAPIHPLVQVLLRIEPPPRMTWHDASRPVNENILMSSLLKLANAEIVDIINWAKAIPGYTELELQQRIRLLESSWMEVLIVGLLWRSMPYPDTLVFTQDFRWTREMCEAANMTQAGDALMLLSQRFAQLSVVQEELVILRAMILLNADMKQIVAGHSVQLSALQEKLQEALHYTVVKRLKRDVGHMTQLLMMLPHIRQSAMNGINHISGLSTRHVVSVEMLDLLKEMLQASSPPHH